MRSSLREIRGVKAKGKQISKLTQLLYDQGYNMESICKEMGIGIRHFYSYFNNPEMFTGSRMKILAYMTHKPLGYIANICFNTPKSSVHWFDENSKPVEQRVKEIKADKSIKPNPNKDDK